jgi:hypothetical protein
MSAVVGVMFVRTHFFKKSDAARPFPSSPSFDHIVVAAD